MREIDGEIAAKKALMAGTGAEGRLAASNAGLAMLARDRRDLAARVADLVGIVLDAGKLAVVAGEIRRISPDVAKLVEACARSGLRREANPEETLRADGPLAALLAGLKAAPEIATPLERAAEDAALRARAQENEAQSRAPAPSAGRGPSVPRLSSDVSGFRDELARRQHSMPPGAAISSPPTRRRPSPSGRSRRRRWWRC